MDEDGGRGNGHEPLLLYIYALGQRRTNIHKHDQNKSSTANKVAAREMARKIADREG